MQDMKNIYNISEVYKNYMDINFEYYKIFYFAAKYGNVTKAATALGSSQPNVTRVLKLLETQLDCRLFVREARGISLTGPGEELYAHVEAACRQLLNAQEALCHPNADGCGTVELGATETALHLFLLDALSGFRTDYPAIRIRIHNHTTPETLKQLVNGRLDFAVLTTPFEPPNACSCVDVLHFREILVGGAHYAGLCEQPLSLAKIRRYPWIGLGRESATYRLYRDFFIARGIDPEPDMEVATSDLMLPLIESNLGIGFVPEKLALPLLQEKKLVHIRLDCDTPTRALQIVSDKERPKSPAARMLYDYLTRTAGAGLAQQA